MSDFQELVYYRTQSMPDNYILSIGGDGEITREAALEHIKNNDEIGRELMDMEREYFDALKTGRLYEDIS